MLGTWAKDADVGNCKDCQKPFTLYVSDSDP